MTDDQKAKREKDNQEKKKKADLVKLGMDFARVLRAEGRPDLGKPADKEFIDSLYERD